MAERESIPNDIKTDKPDYMAPALQILDEAEALSAFQTSATSGFTAPGGSVMWWVS